jgi:lysozyme
MKINSIGIKGLELIKKYEGFSAKPYKCPAGIITIGIGSTFYEDGSKVKLTDPLITEERAIKLLMSLLVSFEKSVDSYTRDDINQNQFDALVSFAYNVGSNALKNSTLLKKVNANPNDPSIKQEFLKWNKSNGKVLKGLTNRRNEEANLYFTNPTSGL